MTKSFSINACIDSCDRLLAKSAQRSATTLLILCALWATFDVPNYRTAPSFSVKGHIWHATLLICSFFIGQNFAMTARNVFPRVNPLGAKIYLIFWSTLGSATLRGTLKAVFEDHYGAATGPIFYIYILTILIGLGLTIAPFINAPFDMYPLFISTVALQTYMMILRSKLDDSLDEETFTWVSPFFIAVMLCYAKAKTLGASAQQMDNEISWFDNRLSNVQRTHSIEEDARGME